MTRSSTVDHLLLSQVVEVSGDAIFSADLDGRLTTWNAAAERLYGCAAADMLGRQAEDLLPEQTAAHLRHVQALALSGERVDRFDTWHLRPDGRHVAVSVTVSPLRGPDGQVVGLATSVQDVGDRVRLAAELEDAHRTLRGQYDAVRRSNRDLEQFAYVASHDLSEPLRIMTGYVQLLEKRYADVLDQRGVRYVHHVVEGSLRMRRLIDDLLEYSRFLRRADALGAVDLRALATQVARDLEVEVEVGDIPDVWSDPMSMTAVLTNLVSNAVKFARPGTSARVAVRGHLALGRVVLTVDDDGIGIEPAYRERVFRMFQRLHAREDYDGTGIGLAIVQQVAETHAGRAWVEDSPLGGARFCLTLPPAARTG